MKILTDSREKQPYDFNYPTEVTGLAVADYSIQGLQDHISIERKSLPDLILSLSKDRSRFERELYKGKSLDYMALIVEASLLDIINHKYRSQMEPKAVIQSLIAFSIRFNLPVWFVGSRECGQMVTESLLMKYCQQVEKKHKLINKGNNG